MAYSVTSNLSFLPWRNVSPDTGIQLTQSLSVSSFLYSVPHPLLAFPFLQSGRSTGIAKQAQIAGPSNKSLLLNNARCFRRNKACCSHTISQFSQSGEVPGQCLDGRPLGVQGSHTGESRRDYSLVPGRHRLDTYRRLWFVFDLLQTAGHTDPRVLPQYGKLILPTREPQRASSNNVVSAVFLRPPREGWVLPSSSQSYFPSWK